MERMLATPADAEIIIKLYQLRTEAVMRKARAWLVGDFWPQTAEEFFAVYDNPADKHNPWIRQVMSYWEMAAAMVIHGAVSAELFVDSNAEGFFILAKFIPILAAIREKNPTFLAKTSEMVVRFSAAAQRLEAIRKRVEQSRTFQAPKPKKRAPKQADAQAELLVNALDSTPTDVPAAAPADLPVPAPAEAPVSVSAEVSQEAPAS